MANLDPARIARASAGAALLAMTAALAQDVKRVAVSGTELAYVVFTCTDAGRIAAPTLLVTGKRTLRLFTLTIDELAKCIPRWERVVLAGTSHGFPLENLRAFDEAVLCFPARH